MTVFFIHLTINYEYISKIFYLINKIFFSLDFFIILCSIIKLKPVPLINTIHNIRKNNL
jgi:hypothetical protein